MTKVPKIVKDRLSTARYYLEAAYKLPPPTRDAAHILLLIVGWENAVLAEQELHAWAGKNKINPKLLKDHAVKLDKIGKNSYVQRIIVGPPGKGVQAKEINYTTGKELEDLREICQYGLATETHDVAQLFHRQWFSDDLSKGLHQKVDWLELWIPLYESV